MAGHARNINVDDIIDEGTGNIMTLQQTVCVGNDEATSKLKRAVKHGDAAWVERLLAAGAKCSDADEQIVSGGCGYDYLLHEAAGHKNGTLMVLMLNAGADVNKRSRNGEHLLTTVARNQSTAVMADLLNMHSVRSGVAFGDACHEALSVAFRNSRKRMSRLLWSFRQKTAEARLLYTEAMSNTEENTKFVRKLLREADDGERAHLYELLGAKCVLNDDLTNARKWWVKAGLNVPDDTEVMEDQALLVLERLVPASPTLIDFLWRASQKALEGGVTEKGINLLHRGISAMRRSNLIRWSKGTTNMLSYFFKLPLATILKRFSLTSLLPILDIFSISYANWQTKWQNADDKHFIPCQNFVCEDCEFMKETNDIFQKLMIMLSPLYRRAGEQEKQSFHAKLVSIMEVHPKLPNMPLFTAQFCLSLKRGHVDVAKCLVRASALVSGTDPTVNDPLHLKRISDTDQMPFHVLAEYLTKKQLLGEGGMVDLMLEHGASLFDRDCHTGEMVIDILERRGLRPPTIYAVAPAA